MRRFPILVILVPALPEGDVRPDLVGYRLPVGSICTAFVAEVVYALGRLQVGAVSTGVMHHLAQKLGVLQHRAGTQVVFIEGLAVVVGHEERAAENSEDAAVVDVGVGVVDEDARFCIARRIDMEIVASACDASDRKSTRLNSSHSAKSRMPSSA